MVSASSRLREMMGFPRWLLSITTVTLSSMPHTRQIQPKSGPEKAFGIVVREIRHAAGLSQLDVYIKFGIDRTQLSAIERGVQSPTLRTIVRLSQAFRVTPTEMMHRMERSRYYRRHGA
jgi:DNA-binding XRE family transcriptional regulator